MSKLKIGSLCSGVGGLDLAVESFFDAETAWFCEFEKAPSKVLDAHWTGVPNHGDMTKVDWSQVEPVDIIAGGTPCQDLSAAGRRQGMTEGTRSNLWVQMREAIATIRPQFVIWENVRGAFSAYAASDVEHEEGLLGEYGPKRPALRALGRVLGDLSDLGYDTQWVGVRAADVGAPHNRFRVFVVAHAQSDARRVSSNRDGSVVTNADESARGERRVTAPGQAESGGPWSDARGRDRAPVANAERDERGRESVQQSWRTSAARSSGDASSNPVSIGRERRRGYGNVACSTREGEADGAERERDGDAVDNRGATPANACDIDRRSSANVAWGAYEPAIRRWEHALGRLAPAPTETSAKGAQRLSPRFVEWMMGLPDGWITSEALRHRGMTRTEQLKALGNGVVPQQALYALELMLGTKRDWREAA